MKTLTLTLSLVVAGGASLSAQTAAPAARPHVAATAHTPVARAATCSTDIPPISPKVPALPAGSACPKPLYTVTSVPTVKLSYVSPFAGNGLADTLGLETSSFSLSYVDTKVGSGPLAVPHKWYTIHYTGYLTDGTKFDSSVDRSEPISINYGQHMVIPGWDTGFGGMHVGGKRRLFIPFQLAYGPQGRPPQIPAKAELIFDVELVAMTDTKPEPKTPPAAPAAKPATSTGSDTPGIQTKPATDAKPASDAKPATSAQPAATGAAKPATPKQ